LNVRIIPWLDIKGPNLVKGIHLEGFRVLGKPERFAKHYYEHGVWNQIISSAYAIRSGHPTFGGKKKEGGS
jgi:cyclase